MQKKDFFDRLTLSMDLPAESSIGQPIVELFGCSRVLIENHGGITQYNDNEIVVKVRFGAIRICGSNMHIAKMSNQRLVICGCIDSVETQRGEGK